MRERSSSALNYGEYEGFGDIDIVLTDELKRDQQMFNEKLLGVNFRLKKGIESMKEGFNQLFSVLEHTGYDRSHLFKEILKPVSKRTPSLSKK